MTYSTSNSHFNEAAATSLLVSQLLSMDDSNWGVFDRTGSRISGVILSGDDRHDLVSRIASSCRFVTIEEDGEELAEMRTGLVPNYDLIPKAFANAQGVSETLGAPVVLYIRNFGAIGALDLSKRSPHFEKSRFVTQVVDGLYAIECDSSRVFVIVSSGEELELTLTRPGRLCTLERLTA
ncbi:MAG: hypothetical protein U0103_24450 [Candidatus Obscuribacterales bacterium]